MASWVYGQGVGILNVDKTLPVNAIPGDSVFPNINSFSNNVGIRTGYSNSNIPYTLTVGGTGFFSNELYLKDNNNYLSYTSNPNFAGPQLVGVNGGGLATSTNVPLFWRADSITSTVPLFTTVLSNLGNAYIASNLYIRNQNSYITYSSNSSYVGPILLGSNGGALATSLDTILYWNQNNVICNREFISDFVTSPFVYGSNVNSLQVNTANLLVSNAIVFFDSSNEYINYSSNQAYQGMQMCCRFGGALCTATQRVLYWSSNGNVTIPGNLSVEGSISGGNISSSTSAHIEFAPGPLNVTLNNLLILPTYVTHTNGSPVSIATRYFCMNPSMSNARVSLTGYYNSPATDAGLYTYQLKLVYNTNNTDPVANWQSLLNLSNQIALITFQTLRGRNFGQSTSISEVFKYPSALLNVNTPIYIGIVPTFAPGNGFTYVKGYMECF